ncbi:hypothetical protein [Janthinobacterium lividum]
MGRAHLVSTEGHAMPHHHHHHHQRGSGQGPLLWRLIVSPR